jgi:hypothetical protein
MIHATVTLDGIMADTQGALIGCLILRLQMGR